MDNTRLWIEFINMCKSHGVDLDFVTHAVYEYCLGGAEEWTFSQEELNNFIDGITLVKRLIG